MKFNDGMNKIYGKWYLRTKNHLKSSTNNYKNQYNDAIPYIDNESSQAHLPKSTALIKCYSKPNLKPRHKLPAISLSNMKTRPEKFKHSKTITKSWDEQGGYIESKHHKTNSYENSLHDKIQIELKAINTIVHNDWNTNSLSELEKENEVLKQQLRAVKEVVDELVRYKKYKHYSIELDKEQVLAKQKVESIQKLVKEKQLTFYQVEYQKLFNRLQALKNPFYRERLEKSHKEINAELENARKRVKKLSMNKRVVDYVITSNNFSRK